MRRDYRLYIKDILDCIEKIEEFTAGMDYEDFVENDLVCSAVIRKLEVIGEASKKVPDFIRTRFSDIPWSDMARMRDKLIHFYFGVDYEIVWKVVKEELPKLKPKIERILIEVEQEG